MSTQGTLELPRGMKYVFMQRFAPYEGAPTPYIPIDPSAYPKISVYKPDGTAQISGVLMTSIGDGNYSYKFSVPVDGTLGRGWYAKMVMLSDNQAQIERELNFVITEFEAVEPETTNQTVVVSPINEQIAVVLRLPYAQTFVELTLREPDGNTIVFNLSSMTESNDQDGFVVYVVDSYVARQVGEHSLRWKFRRTQASPFDFRVQTLVVPPEFFWQHYSPRLLTFLDKLQKYSNPKNDIHQYTAGELYMVCKMGVEYLNGFHPYTSWSFDQMDPASNGALVGWVFTAASMLALSNQFLLEGELQHDLSALQTSLSFDHSSTYQTAIDWLKQDITDRFVIQKRIMIRRQQSPAIAARPHSSSKFVIPMARFTGTGPGANTAYGSLLSRAIGNFGG